MSSSEPVPRSDNIAPGELPKRLDGEQKDLLMAIFEFSSLLRRREPPGDSKLALGRTLRRHGLEQRHAAALLTIGLYGPMTVTQLSDRHHVTVKTSSLIGVELERAGLIQRRPDPADRRRTILTIPEGKQRAVNEGLARRAAVMHGALERLTPAQRNGLITGLRVLAEEMASERPSR